MQRENRFREKMMKNVERMKMKCKLGFKGNTFS